MPLVYVLVARQNWFTETRSATSVSPTQVQFEKESGNFKANNKIYLQGDKSLISEAGEWALEHKTGMLYYWPRDQQAMQASALESKRGGDAQRNGRVFLISFASPCVCPPPHAHAHTRTHTDHHHHHHHRRRHHPMWALRLQYVRRCPCVPYRYMPRAEANEIDVTATHN